MRAACSLASWTARSAVRWASTRVLRKASSLPPASDAAASARWARSTAWRSRSCMHLEAGGYLLEEMVDILGVIAAHLLAELDLTQRLGRDVHGAMLVRVEAGVRDRGPDRYNRASTLLTINSTTMNATRKDRSNIPTGGSPAETAPAPVR